MTVQEPFQIALSPILFGWFPLHAVLVKVLEEIFSNMSVGRNGVRLVSVLFRFMFKFDTVEEWVQLCFVPVIRTILQFFVPIPLKDECVEQIELETAQDTS